MTMKLVLLVSPIKPCLFGMTTNALLPANAGSDTSSTLSMVPATLAPFSAQIVSL